MLLLLSAIQCGRVYGVLQLCFRNLCEACVAFTVITVTAACAIYAYSIHLVSTYELIKTAIVCLPVLL